MPTVSIACAIPHGIVLQNGGGLPTGNDPIVLAGPPLVSLGFGTACEHAQDRFGVTTVDADLWASWALTHPQLVTLPGGDGCWLVE